MPMVMMGKQASISISVEPEIKDALTSVARAEGRSLANTIRQILREHVRQLH